MPQGWGVPEITGPLLQECSCPKDIAQLKNQ